MGLGSQIMFPKLLNPYLTLLEERKKSTNFLHQKYTKIKYFARLHSSLSHLLIRANRVGGGVNMYEVLHLWDSTVFPARIYTISIYFCWGRDIYPEQEKLGIAYSIPESINQSKYFISTKWSVYEDGQSMSQLIYCRHFARYQFLMVSIVYYF